MLLLIAGICPGDTGPEVARTRLFDGEPPVRKWLRIISDKTQPVFLLPRWDSVGFGQNTCDDSVDIPKERRSKLTDCTFPLRVVLFRDMVRPLILEVSCTSVSTKTRDISQRTYFRM